MENVVHRSDRRPHPVMQWVDEIGPDGRTHIVMRWVESTPITGEAQDAA